MNKYRERLLRKCLISLHKKGFGKNQEYVDRLKKEIKSIDEQAEHEYLLDLHDRFKQEGLIMPVNEHNNIVDWLLDIAPDFDIDKPSAFIQGEFPDIDIDYLKPVRDWLKSTWSIQTFGQENVCEIGTYGTAGIKSSILDMTGVHGASKTEIQSITVKMEDKDEDGKVLEWDKALEIYPEFNAYCEQNPEIASAAKLMQGRNKSVGVHPGGLIISDRPIPDLVPMEVRKVNKDNPNGVICSAWSEGLAHQDLGPVGLIKFDLLVVNNLMQIALACNLIKQRHGLSSICAAKDGWDWSDISYLNDPKSIEMANRADLKCIFQFDSDGIRKLVKRGGVTSFDDLPAYSSIYRPGPLNLSMDDHYCRRKKWKLDPNDPEGEPYNIPPLLEPALGVTYGILVYQEQVMEILRLVGSIPAFLTEKVRKAISKKKVKEFVKYKDMFVENGKINLGWNTDSVLDLWDQVEAFSAYGFNRAHAYAYTYISARLLWLKAHYPLEFYTAVLMCEEDTDKFRDYRHDAANHGITINGVDINKSDANFSIKDGEIYFGFKNIKGIGEEPASMIVEGQPYKNCADFLERFGTDSKIAKPLIALGCFNKDGDRVTIRKFYDFFKDSENKRQNSIKRNKASMDKKDEELRQVLLTYISENDPDFESMASYTEEAMDLWKKRLSDFTVEKEYKSRGRVRIKNVPVFDILKGLYSRRQKSLERFEEKQDCDSQEILNNFNPNLFKLDKDEQEIYRDSMAVNGEITYPMAESLYYGFQWVHEIETCEGYQGRTIDFFLNECEVKGDSPGCVEVKIIEVKHRTSRNNVKFKTITAEDANAKRIRINVWMDDYIRFEHLWKVGKFVAMRVRPPSGGYNTFTFESVPRHLRKNLGPVEEDFRMIELKSNNTENLEKAEKELDDMGFDIL